MPDATLQSSNRFERLIDFLGKITQVFSTNGLNDLLFLVGQREGLAEIPICKRLFRFAEQGFAKLVTDNRRRK